MTLTTWELTLAGLAGAAAGLVNAIAGGGTLISFPAMTATSAPGLISPFDGEARLISAMTDTPPVPRSACGRSRGGSAVVASSILRRFGDSALSRAICARLAWPIRSSTDASRGRSARRRRSQGSAASAEKCCMAMPAAVSKRAARAPDAAPWASSSRHSSTASKRPRPSRRVRSSRRMPGRAGARANPWR